MPGDYGPAGKWTHDRAHHILESSPDLQEKGQRGKSIAYALATQQAHKTGKSPKDFRTSEGVREAKRKYDAPKKLYVQTAAPKSEATGDRLEKLRKASSAYVQRMYAAEMLKMSAGPPPSIPTPQFPSGLMKIQPTTVAPRVTPTGQISSANTPQNYTQVHSQPSTVNSEPYTGVKSAQPPSVNK